MFIYLSTQDLEVRGWTKGLIKKLLPEPSDIKYFGYGCQFFYGVLRVEKIDQAAAGKSSAPSSHRESFSRKKKSGKILFIV